VTRTRPPDVETLACAVAGEYAGRWARSVARARPRGEGDAPSAAWLVDAFAGADLQRAALRGAAVSPPALAFVRAADEALGGGARIVLVEEDPGLLARLEDELRGAGAGGRLRRAGDPVEVAPGEIALIEAPLASVAHRLADAIGEAPALARLAPLGARTMPWIALEPLALLPAADLLIRVPREDLAKVGSFSGPLADFPPHLRRVAEGCSAMFADPRHAWLLAWRDAARAGGEETALAGAADRLRTMLSDAGEERMNRSARLEAGGGAVHLLLSTPRAEHALELNGAISDGGASPPASASPRAARAPAARTSASVPSAPSPAGAASSADPPRSAAPASPDAASTGEAPPADPAASVSIEADPPADVLDLFPLPPAPEPQPRGPDPRAVADGLHAENAGRRVPFRDLLAGLADTGLAPEQVRTALGILKRAGRASFRSLDAEGAEVEFRPEPSVSAASSPQSTPKPRKPRREAPGLLGLFDDAEPEAAPPAKPDAAPPATMEDAAAPPAEPDALPRSKSRRRRSVE